MTTCLLCSAEGGDLAGWTSWTTPAEVTWTDRFTKLPTVLAPPGQHPVCAPCSTWLAGDRAGLPAGVMHLIGDALDHATAVGIVDHQTRRSMREELVGMARHLADHLQPA